MYNLHTIKYKVHTLKNLAQCIYKGVTTTPIKTEKLPLSQNIPSAALQTVPSLPPMVDNPGVDFYHCRLVLLLIELPTNGAKECAIFVSGFFCSVCF
jgi:hypothetical protein